MVLTPSQLINNLSFPIFLLSLVSLIIMLFFYKRKTGIVILSIISMVLTYVPWAHVMINFLPKCDRQNTFFYSGPYQRCDCLGIKINEDLFTFGLTTLNGPEWHQCLGVITSTYTED